MIRANSLGFKVRGSSENRGRLKEAIKLMLVSYSKMLFCFCCCLCLIVCFFKGILLQSGIWSPGGSYKQTWLEKRGTLRRGLSATTATKTGGNKITIHCGRWLIGKAWKIELIVGPTMISIFNAVNTFFLYMNNSSFWVWFFLGLLIILVVRFFRRDKTRLTGSVSTREVQEVVLFLHVRAIYRLTAVPFIRTCVLIFSQFSSWRKAD